MLNTEYLSTEKSTFYISGQFFYRTDTTDPQCIAPFVAIIEPRRFITEIDEIVREQ